MDFKEFCEKQEIEFKAIAVVNGAIIARVTAPSVEDLEERMVRLSEGVAQKLNKDYTNLPEPEAV